MFQIFQQILAKIISTVATFIISVGIVQFLPVEYQIIPRKTPEIKQEIKSLSAKISEMPQSTTSPKEKPKLKENSSPAQQPTQQPEEQPAAQPPSFSLIELNQKTRNTIVNIFCVTETGGSFRPITGSGVVVSPKGIILTTAHIGQYFLLKNSPETEYLDCIIRSGDIAQPAYEAKLAYIPPIWIEENAENIIQQEPEGTGENDYSFLSITKSIIQGKELQKSFDFSEPNLDFNILPAGFSVLLASYPAGFLGGISVQKDLGLISTFAPITNLYTFATTGPVTLDIFSLGGNIGAQSGSSGGAVIDTKDGKLLGIIVTSTSGTTTSTRELNAITMPHIKRSFEKYAGKSLGYFLDDPETYAVFSSIDFNRLKNLLVNELKKR